MPTPLDELFAANTAIAFAGPVTQTVSLNWRDALRAYIPAAEQTRLAGLTLSIKTQ